MAVDQARHLNFFKEMHSTSNNNNNQIQIGNNLYSNSNITTSLGAGATGAAVLPAAMMAVNESLLYPLYNMNDVVFQSIAGKLPPAVKDDSGVTFNNSLVPSAPASRKRTREPLAIISGSAIPLIPSTGSNFSKESKDFTFLGEDLTLQIAQQQLELDRLISQHMEKMRIEIEEKKRRQMRRIMAVIEEAMVKKLRDKEEDIDKISKVNWALEERVKSLLLENQIWRDLAQTNEATANALRTNLEQVLQNAERPTAIAGGGLTDDAVSCCGSSGYGGEDDEDSGERWQKRRVDGGEGNKWIYRGKNEGSNSENGGKRLCKKCGKGESSVLLLQCRHLCLCKSCGPTVNFCPICNSAKNASVHVNWS